MDERLHPPFPEKSDLEFTKNYRYITLTAIATKVYYVLLFIHIQPEVEKVLRKNRNSFQRNQFTYSQILTICQIIEGIFTKKLEAALLFVNFSELFDSIQREKSGGNTTHEWFSKRNGYGYNDAL